MQEKESVGSESVAYSLESRRGSFMTDMFKHAYRVNAVVCAFLGTVIDEPDIYRQAGAVLSGQFSCSLDMVMPVTLTP